MASLQFRYVLSPLSPSLPLPPTFSRAFPFPPRFPGKLRAFSLARRGRVLSICCGSSKTGSQLQRVAVPEDDDRPPFDINLAVILAGFAFEAYTTPPVRVPFLLSSFEKMEENKLSANSEAVWTEKFLLCFFFLSDSLVAEFARRVFSFIIFAVSLVAEIARRVSFIFLLILLVADIARRV